MSRSGGAIGAAFIKWVLVPIVLAVIGFYFVGPRVASKYLSEKPAAPVRLTAEPVEEAPKSKSMGEPKVEISAQRVKSPKRIRHRPKSVPAAVRPAPEESPEPLSPEPEPAPNPSGDNG